MLTIGQERSAPTEINVGQDVRALTFTANGEYLATGDDSKGVEMWRVKDGKQVARVETGYVRSLAASKDGKWIAVGASRGIFVWNAETYEVVEYGEGEYVRAVDFSPDSRLVAGMGNKKATIWDLATGKRVQTLYHQDYLIAGKYSPRGFRIATATDNGTVGVWDSNDGRLLVDIDVKVIPWYNAGLLWSNNRLFVVSYKAIEEFDASTGSKVSGWSVPDASSEACIALPKHEQFIAFSANRTVTSRPPT